MSTTMDFFPNKKTPFDFAKEGKFFKDGAIKMALHAFHLAGHRYEQATKGERETLLMDYLQTSMQYMEILYGADLYCTTEIWNWKFIYFLSRVKIRTELRFVYRFTKHKFKSVVFSEEQRQLMRKVAELLKLKDKS